MSKFLVSVSNFLKRLECTIPQFFGRGFPPEALCIAGMDTPNSWNNEPAKSKFSLKDLIGNGILWAVPKHRRSVEKRLKRKFGVPDYVLKILTPKTTLRVCNQCGHDHEVGVLCPHCYEKVKNETTLMQEQIKSQLGLEPIEQEVVVLYEGEKHEEPSEYLNGKRIIEMDKPRPMWFSKNLMQKTTQKPATTKEVKPDKLG